MFQLIKNYVSKMTKDDVIKFTQKNDIYLNESELDFVYRFIKKNYEALYANPNIDLSKYKANFTEENYTKIVKLISVYKSRYLGL
ncbi:MAG: hypothetical protein HFG33_01240 [Bacilli bacterium]|nr:hypothetical protein [Bacilli bacterium]